MLPYLVPGAIVVGVRVRRIRAGDVVIVRHNGLDKVKRVKEARAGKVFLVGDNPGDSTDGRNFGWLDIRLIVAKVVWPKT